MRVECDRTHGRDDYYDDVYFCVLCKWKMRIAQSYLSLEMIFHARRDNEHGREHKKHKNHDTYDQLGEQSVQFGLFGHRKGRRHRLQR